MCIFHFRNYSYLFMAQMPWALKNRELLQDRVDSLFLTEYGGIGNSYSFRICLLSHNLCHV